MQTVLLTGYPSVLAHRVLLELTSDAPRVGRVLVLVRSKAVDEARELLATLPAPRKVRVEMLEGDVSAIDLGLSGAEHRELVSCVSLVHHTAHVAYPGVDRETAEAGNVTGTREILEVCKSARARLVHYSTCFVSGDRRGLVRETELDEGQGFPSVIEETRARAEKLVRRYDDRVRAVIVRPSTIVGDTKTGAYDRLEGPYSLARMLLAPRAELGVALPGDRDTPVHVAPVDYVARAAVELGFDEAALGQTFHLTDPQPASVPEAFDAIAQLVGRPQLRGVVAPGVARAVMRTAFMQRLAPRPASLAATLSRRVRYASDNAQTLLAPRGISCPSLPTYLPVLVDFVQHRASRDAAHDSLPPSSRGPASELSAEAGEAADDA